MDGELQLPCEVRARPAEQSATFGTMKILRACAFDFPLTVPRSRSGGYDERKLEQTSKPKKADGLVRKPKKADGLLRKH